MEEVDRRLQWLAAMICMPTWSAAVGYVVARTEACGFELDLQADRSLRDASPGAMRRIAEALKDPALACAWRLLALRPTYPSTEIDAVVGDACSLIAGAEGDMTQALARLRSWSAVGRGERLAVENDFFRGAGGDDRAPAAVPVCVEMLARDRWDEAFGWLTAQTRLLTAGLGIEGCPTPEGDREKQRMLIERYAELLFSQGRNWTGELALAWQMLACDPERPESFNFVLPPLGWLLDRVAESRRKTHRLARLDIWWRAARGEWAGAIEPVSIFRIAERETADDFDDEGVPPDPEPLRKPSPPPGVVVMRGRFAEERGLPLAWRDLRDEHLPLVLCEDAARVREKLREEYPHAHREIDLLTQDLRDGQAVRMRPTLLVSPETGMGKSRLVGRLAELLGGNMYVYRFDGAASHDGAYSGFPKGWSSAHPSVPARAIMMSRIANPIAFVDEIDRAGESTYNGNLWSAMLPFLDVETSRRYREAGIDAELDLSHVLHFSTANSVEKLPSQLRDRFRVIRMPPPTLAHLPALAALIMKELASKGDLRFHEPLGPDELDNIGWAWKRERFSMRKLKRLIEATLEARDACAVRH
jgi:ATP-dependent Lon protease